MSDIERDLGYRFPWMRDGASNTPTEALYWKRLVFSFPLAAAAAADDAEQGLMVAPHRMQVVAAYVLDTTGTAKDAAEYRDYEIVNVGTAGAGTDIVAEESTTDTAITAKVPWALTLSTTHSKLIVERGEALILDADSTGSTGKAVNITGVLVIIAKAIE